MPVQRDGVAPPAAKAAPSSETAVSEASISAAIPPGTATPGLAPAEPFWKVKSLEAMTTAEWESLCDGCARCCLNKLEDWDTGEIVWTAIACELLDDDSCRCSDYPNRTTRVPDCIPLDPLAVRTLTWLPASCAYRLVAEGRDLYWWHPLVSGDAETVHEAGISVTGRTVSEADIPVEEYEDFVVTWPGELPEG